MSLVGITIIKRSITDWHTDASNGRIHLAEVAQTERAPRDRCSSDAFYYTFRNRFRIHVSARIALELRKDYNFAAPTSVNYQQHGAPSRRANFPSYPRLMKVCSIQATRIKSLVADDKLFIGRFIALCCRCRVRLLRYDNVSYMDLCGDERAVGAMILNG
ncbi:hypothetical protein EVAR_81073_1 [Eumeta japonica]|uniref:Uncharacterized protein n=1 Tax=Eumeta variegata TaxID=151549 RepID=A0A4C1T5M1_EUMVA|nr:hypothetical protein EVAR_81073_1 [Eumeta japonica]